MYAPGSLLSNVGLIVNNNLGGQPAAVNKIGEADLPAHVSFPQVSTVLSPTYSTLRVLTTGALGSVL